MDINGVKFHMLTSYQDWQPILTTQALSQQDTHMWWDADRLALGLIPRIPRFNQNTQILLTADKRRGAAADIYGNVFWISDDRDKILVQASGLSEADVFWSVQDLNRRCIEKESHGDFKPIASSPENFELILQGLTITKEQYLVVGTIEPGGILVFDLYDGGAPLWLQWPLDEFTPLDFSSDSQGGLWILDIHSETYIWHLDRFFRVVVPQKAAANTLISPHISVSSDNVTCFSLESITKEHGIKIDIDEAIAIEALPDRTILILGNDLEAQGSVILRYDYDQLLNQILLNDEKLNAIINKQAIVAHDFIFLKHTSSEPGKTSGDLFIVDEVGNQAYLFSLVSDHEELELSIRPRYLPLRQYAGKGLVTVNNTVHYDINDHWYPITPQPRQRYEARGQLAGIILDGKVPDCTWHRVLFDACIPQDAAIQVETRTADEEEFLSSETWSIEPQPYQKHIGSEITLHEPYTDKEKTHEKTGTWELLLQQAKGRYIEIRLTLTGNGRVSPQIRAMRVYYPRFSYLQRYLPAVYSDNPDSASFLDRFLANVEGFYSSIEDRIAKSQALVDVRTAPNDFLEWLGNWVNIAFDPDWDDYRRRLFLANALLLYRWRGTQIGLRTLIRLAIDPCPDENIFSELKDQTEYTFGAAVGHTVRIVEKFLMRGYPGVVLGDPRELQGPSTITLKEQSTGVSVDTHYRDFLRRQYADVDDSEADVLAKLNAAWERTFNSFSDIVYGYEPPKNANELADWQSFIREEVALYQQWQPVYGGYVLHVRFQNFLRNRYSELSNEQQALQTLNNAWNKTYTSFDEIRFSAIKPTEELIAEDWLRFTKSAIGFNYAEITNKDVNQYREFLARRYQRINNLNEIYQLSENPYKAFEEINLPDSDNIPKDGVPLQDWIAFVSTTVPIKRSAHQFTVLVPTVPGELPEARKFKLSKVNAIVQHEKPSHTRYDVKLYWALFQVGSARLGADTLLGESSRYVAIVLGVNYLGQGFIAESFPWNMENRSVLGRESLQQTAYGEHRNE